MALRVASEYRFLCLPLHMLPATERDRTASWLCSHLLFSLSDWSTWKEVVRFVKVSLRFLYCKNSAFIFVPYPRYGISGCVRVNPSSYESDKDLGSRNTFSVKSLYKTPWLSEGSHSVRNSRRLLHDSRL